MQTKGKRPRTFLEPFAGGAITGLTIAFENLASQVILVEIDHDVASVWQSLLGGDAEQLAKRIEQFELTTHSVQDVISRPCKTTADRAFQTIVRNRVNHGGILAPGSGRIKLGENGRGLNSRWYPTTLASRIRAIGQIKDRIKFFHCDGMEVIEAYSERSDVVFFIDPPYTAAGKRAGTRLYAHSTINHGLLFDRASRAKGDVLMTYDSAIEVAELALVHGFDIEPVPMKGTHNVTMTELLIGKNLAWAR